MSTKRNKEGITKPVITTLVAATLLTPIAQYVPTIGINPTVETRLTGQASDMVRSDAAIRFNGRDGYLSAVEGVDGRALADQVETIRGVRNVEVVNDFEAMSGDEGPENGAPSFALSYGENGWSQQGTAPLGIENVLGRFVTEPDVSADLPDVDPTVERSVTTAAGFFGNDLIDGTIAVDGTAVTVTGTPATDDAATAIAAELGDVENLTLNLGEPAGLRPAQFALNYDDETWTMNGSAPDSVSFDGIVDSPTFEEGIRVGHNVNDTLARLTPLFGEAITAGGIEVNGSQVSLTGTVADNATADQLRTQFAGVYGLDLDLVTVDGEGAGNGDGDDQGQTADVGAEGTFALSYNGVSWAQQNAAPESLGTTLTEFTGAPQLDASLPVADGLDNTLGEIRAIFEENLIRGDVTVDSATGAITVDGVGSTLEKAAVALTELGRLDGVSATVVEPTEADTAQNELNELSELGAIEFVTATATPTPATEGIIDRIAEVLTNFPEIAVEINGHTDDEGDEGLNQQLSQDRAEAVLDALVARGIDAERMTATGFGESQPIADNATPEGRQANRRVEIIAKESE